MLKGHSDHLVKLLQFTARETKVLGRKEENAAEPLQCAEEETGDGNISVL